MPDQEKDKQIDEMLDSLLANYSSVEPRPGLETRILANLHEAKKTPQGWGNFKWIWAGVMAAVAVIMVVALLNGRHRVTPPTKTVAETKPPVPPTKIQRHAPVARQTTARAPRHKPSAAPTSQHDATLAVSRRPAVFPTPTPLSEQERLLLIYYSRTPREELIAQSHPDEPPVVGQSGPD